jgi:hypothetical protein
LGTDFAAIEKEMNVLGAEGWELVKVFEVLGSGTSVFTAALIATLKRTAGVTPGSPRLAASRLGGFHVLTNRST